MDRADRDLTGLTVLALLFSGPRHTYDMHRRVLDTRKDFISGLPRSLYHAVDRLAGQGLIEAVGVEREGTRPERTTYALTAKGRDAIRVRLSRLLETPDPNSTLFQAALSFASILSANEVAGALRARTERLGELLGAEAAPASLPRVLRIEDEFERHRLHAELDWVRSLATEIENGRIEWPDVDSLASLLPEYEEEDPATT